MFIHMLKENSPLLLGGLFVATSIVTVANLSTEVESSLEAINTQALETNPVIQMQPIVAAPENQNSTDEPTILVKSVLESPENTESIQPSTSMVEMGQTMVAESILMANNLQGESLDFGPLTACFDRVRAFTCPIVGSIPVVRSIAGEIAHAWGLTCPINPGV